MDRALDAIALLLSALETKHGPVAFSSSLRASSAAADARAWALGLQEVLGKVEGSLYPPEARSALVAYARHLESSRMRLGDAIRTREAELSDYGVGVVDEELERNAGGRGTKNKR